MKKVLLTLMMVMMVSVIPSQAQNQRLKLAVYATGNVDALLKNIAQNTASAELVNCEHYQMIERSSEFLKFVSEEQNYQRSGAVDENQIAELGKQYGADCVCVIDITHMDSYLYVATRMIDVVRATSQNAGFAENTNYSSPVDLRRTVSAAVRKMEGIDTATNNNQQFSHNSGNSAGYNGNYYQGHNQTEKTSGVNMETWYEQDQYDTSTASEQIILNWEVTSRPAGADIYWRVISSTPEVKNTNKNYKSTTPYESTESFDIKGLTYNNSGNVQIEITCDKPGYLPQKKVFNVRAAMDQKSINAHFTLVKDE